MDFFRKNLFGLAIASFLALSSVLAIGAFHHHDALESRTDCSFCVWQHSGSQAASVPVSPALLLVVLVLAVRSAFRPFILSTSILSFQGRAPPPSSL